MDGRMRHETTPTVALTAIHATVVLPLSPSLPLSLSLPLPVVVVVLPDVVSAYSY